jgi:hypothetical protein
MHYVLLHHTVADYREFKAVYDGDIPHRHRRGSLSSRLFRTAGNPNDLYMLFEFDDAEKAHTFAAGGELMDAMHWASVTGKPELVVLEEIEQDEA